jgi:vitamin B12 transporter
MILLLSVPHGCLLGLLLLAASGTTSVLAGSGDLPPRPDTSTHAPSRSYAIDEVTVTSVRIPSTVDRSPSPVTLISRTTIEQSGAGVLSDILGSGPGLFIKDYGAASGIKTISQRGLGTEHTLVLLNGLPVSSLLTGSLDFGIVPAEEIERVEIVRGGQSASFGANAVAGTVNILTRAQRDERVTVRLSTGSFGQRDLSVNLGDRQENLLWRIGGGVQHEEGDYPYEFDDGSSTFRLVRNNAQLNAHRFSGDIEASLNSSLRVHATALYLNSERGVPGIVMNQYSTSRATQRDQQGIAQCGLTQTLAAGLWWELKLQGVYTYQRYADPDLVVGGVALDNSFRSTEGQGEILVHKEAGSAGRYTLGADVVSARAIGSAVSGSPLRRQLGLFVASEHRVALSTDSTLVVGIHPALRFDHVQSIGDVVSPQLGLQLLLSPADDSATSGFRIHGTVGRNFRTPTFNELFYSGGGGRGNPDLRPERSLAYDLGIGCSFTRLGEHELDATYFVVEMRDRIIWTTAGSATTTPKNLRDVVSRGVEVSYRYALPSVGASLSFAYTRSRTEKTSSDYPGDPNVHMLLPYCPQELLSCTALWGTDLHLAPLTGWTVSMGWSHAGFRYTTEDNSSYLPAYHLVNAGVSLRAIPLGLSAVLRCDVRNLMNTSYTVMPGYPMPGRSYRLSIAISY